MVKNLVCLKVKVPFSLVMGMKKSFLVYFIIIRQFHILIILFLEPDVEDMSDMSNNI